MKTLTFVALSSLFAMFSSIESVQASQTFKTALNAHAVQYGQKVIFSAQSGNYGVGLTTVHNEEGPMEVYKLSLDCSCWKLIASGGGVVNDAHDLESIFGIDSADAAILAPQIKSFEANQ